MLSVSGRLCQQFGLVCAALLLADKTVLAQSIVAEPGATATQVNQSANQFEITGGTLSADGANLFHSFQQFGLTSEQIADFISPAEVSNIVGRVNGGSASYIDGLLQVSGSQANLFLLNPAGILFGANARLDLGGDFTAATSTGLMFGDRSFAAFGDNNYAALVGDPTGFVFELEQAGAIANAGDLAVASGRSLSLIAATVVNTGTLTAAAGELLVAAVPGASLIRISHPELVLSLEIAPLPATSALALQPFDLPGLLTGEAAPSSTEISVNPDGSVSLVGQSVTIPTAAGTVIVSGLLDTGGVTGGQIAVVGDRVALLDSTLNASGQNGGGTLRIGGDYQGRGSLPGATQTYISADSRLQASATEQGDGGRVIVWADDTTQFYGAIAANGGALAGNGGLVEVSGKDSLVFRGTVDVAAVNGAAGTLLLDPDTLTIIDAADGAGTLDGELTPDTDDKLFAAVPNSGANTISVGQLEAFGSTAQIVLQADNGITIANIASDLIALNLETNLNPDNSVDPLTSGSITFIADADNDGVGNFSMNPGDTIQTNGGSVIIRGADILVGNIQTDAFVIGNVDIQGSSLRIGRIDSGAIGVFGTGRINLTATEGDIVVDSLEAGSGGIRIEAAGLFQAIGSDLEFFTIPPVDFSGVPVSLLVRAFSAQAKQVVILHNGASEPASGEPIVIAGSGTAFALGPSVDNPSAPGQLGTDATYTPFVLGSAEFPVSVSGTVGAIAVGAGSDATLVTSLQNQPFVPGLEPVPPVPDFDAASLDQLEPDADLAASLSRSATASAPTETPENPETPPTNCTAQRIELNPEGLPELRGACLEEDTEQVPAEPK